MSAVGSMWSKTACGFSRTARSYLFRKSHRDGFMWVSTSVVNPDGKSADTEPEKETSQATDKVPSASAAEKALIEERNNLQEDLKELKDRYIRSLAEMENLRQRMKKQVDDAKLYGIQGFCKDLLDVADILNTATTTVPKELLNDNPHLKSLYDGLTMTESQLQKVFNKHGLVQISPAEGDKFDPNFHEALFQVPTQEKESDTIAIIQKIGYRLHDRTIRPALVGVFMAS